MLYFRQIATATALYGFFALVGFLPAVPALADGITQSDTPQTDRFYDVQTGTYVSIMDQMVGRPRVESAAGPQEEANIPSHVQQNLNNN